MNFDFYLSEIAITDRHGGGITFQRVLQEKMLQIERYFYVSTFSIAFESSTKIPQNLIYYAAPPLYFGSLKKYLGNTVINRIYSSNFYLRFYARHIARTICNCFGHKPSLRAFIVPQTKLAIYVIEELRKMKEIKYLTWVMDDHVVRWKNGKWSYPRGYEKKFAFHLRNAAQVFVISDQMKEFYKQRFLIDSDVLFSPPVSQELTVNSKVADAKTERLRGCYFGSIGGWQFSSLNVFLDVMNRIPGFSFDIYSNSKDERLMKYKAINWNGFISATKIVNVAHEKDFIFVPLSFEAKYRNMSYLNYATKMAESLATGLPVIIMGPADSAMVKFFRLHNCGIVIDSLRPEDILKGVNQLFDREVIKSVLQNARLVVLEECSVEKMREKLLKAIQKIDI